jgi:hypothetical protein
MASEQGNRVPLEETKPHRAGNGGKSGSTLSAESQRLMGAGTRMASIWLGSQKSTIAQRLHDAALGLRNFSGNLEDRPNLREYVQAAADGIDTLSEEVERRDLEELARTAEDAIRRQPVAVFAGLLITGMLIARMLRSDPQAHGLAHEDEREAVGD